LQVATEVVEEVQEAAASTIEDTSPAPATKNAGNSSSSKANLTGAAAWYQEYGRSVPPTIDACDFYYGANRPLWKGPFTQPKDVPEWLTGEFPGDYGCDIFRLVRLPANYARLRSQACFRSQFRRNVPGSIITLQQFTAV